MMSIYEGALDNALRLPRAANPDLWMVQPLTRGPFAEPSRIPRDTRDLVRRIPGVAAACAVTFQTVQTTAEGKPLRLFLQGYEIGRPGGPANIVAGHGLTESHYQLVGDVSSGLRLGEEVLLGPYRDLYTVVGLTGGMVTSAGDAVGWITLLDAQALQFAIPPPLERREVAAGRNPPVTTDVNAVLVHLLPGVAPGPVAAEIDRWKHFGAVTEPQEEGFLIAFVIDKMQRQLGMFTAILIAVSALIIALIIYTLTMDKLRSIATLADWCAGPYHHRAGRAAGAGAGHRRVHARHGADHAGQGLLPAPRGGGTKQPGDAVRRRHRRRFARLGAERACRGAGRSGEGTRRWLISRPRHRASRCAACASITAPATRGWMPCAT